MVRKYSLKELRARHELTQKDMADRLGIAYQTYNAWEQAPSEIKVSQLLALAEILEVEMQEIKL